MERELDIAIDTAKVWAELPAHGNGVRTLARVFLAQQSKVAALEAERDEWKLKAEAEGIRLKWRDQDFAAAESRLALARVEGAREALTRFLKERREGTASDDQWDMLCDLERFRDREYPAPAAPAGEARRCDCRTLTPTAACDSCRPAPTPEPEPLVLVVDIDGKECEVTLTPTYCRLIVALGSRPTQTAEG